jgi:alpha-ketoglutarate-dependent taurine dioxygenase
MADRQRIMQLPASAHLPSHFAYLAALVEQVKATGVAFSSGHRECDLAAIADCLGRTIQVTDVEVQPASREPVLSDRALPPHTDHHAARYVGWYCERHTGIGGEKLVIDAWRAVAALPSEYRTRLEAIQLLEREVFPDDPSSRPMLAYRNGCPRIHYSFGLVDKSLHNDVAIAAFAAAVRAAPCKSFRLASGDILLIDNHRMLHARNAIGGTRDRLLRRYWIAERCAPHALAM